MIASEAFHATSRGPRSVIPVRGSWVRWFRREGSSADTLVGEDNEGSGLQGWLAREQHSKKTDSAIRAQVLPADKDDAAAGESAVEAEFPEIFVRGYQNAGFGRRARQYILVRGTRLDFSGIGDIMAGASQERDSLRLDVLVGVELQRLSPSSGM